MSPSPSPRLSCLARVDALYRRIGGSENTEDVLSSGPFVLHLRSRTLRTKTATTSPDATELRS